MSGTQLIIGNKNYSSWSLRGWLAAKQAGIDFHEVLVPLDQPGTKERLLGFSPAGKVPTLIHEGRTIWDSLAIVEYLAELCPDAKIWPADTDARAHARSISAEMHAGFAALRSALPMNLRKSLPGRGRGPEVENDIRRIMAIWRSCRERFGTNGPFLFGGFSGADAMYAPVATRFRTYGVETDSDCAAYVSAVCDHPWMKEWYHAGANEPWVIAADEVD